MSSTNRGYERHKVDFYVTPQGCIREFLGYWLDDLMGEFHDDQLGVATNPEKAKWLDPCAGGDATHLMSYPTVIKEEFEPEILDTIDYREDSKAEIKEDYLHWDKGKNEYDVIITNPPFYIAKEVIEKALEDVSAGGYVVMLLRLNFFGSNQRLSFWQKQLPIWAYVHHRRFSFTDDGKTDSIEYCHMVWQRDVSPAFTMLKII